MYTQTTSKYRIQRFTGAEYQGVALQQGCSLVKSNNAESQFLWNALRVGLNAIYTA
ncbi:hypothetical protein ACSSVW_001174 [Pseudoalteromonas sp. MBR-15]|jgi:hypothetical protein|uniref:hypothetical protein n=1 Tax=Pseudoalteromonas lipolytica TaxID=570156 RepID=UPI003BA1B56F